MDRDDYNSKLSEMLSDTTTYKKLNHDPSAALERKMNSTLLGLNRSGQIPDRLYHRLRSSSGSTPRIYGLPKIHKQDVPLRPIVSFYSSPTYQLSKHLSSLLSPFVGKTLSYVRNSREFAQFIINQELEDGEVLISFDVVSLFTSVPIDLALKVVRDRLEHDETLHERTYLDSENIISLLDLCLNATYLQFQNVVYWQVHGTAMGSPVSVTITNLVMEDIEQRALSTFRTPLQFWKRYVDDTCTAIQPCIIEEFHQHLNSIEPSIQFTYEIEQNNQLPFLDNRQDDCSILTSVFRKSTHTDRYLHFNSHHPQLHKQSVVRTLFSRAESLSSCPLKSIEELHVSKALQDNGYPERFIHSRLTTLTLPYLKGP